MVQKIKGCGIRGCSFRGVRNQRVLFQRGAFLEGALLEGADLEGAQIKQNRISSCAQSTIFTIGTYCKSSVWSAESVLEFSSLLFRQQKQIIIANNTNFPSKSPPRAIMLYTSGSIIILRIRITIVELFLDSSFIYSTYSRHHL